MRNVRCPLYGECLDQAARANMPGFSCGHCARRHDRAAIDPHEAQPCAVLLAFLFLPELYRQYLLDLCELAAAGAAAEVDETEIPGEWDGMGKLEIV